MLSLILAIGHPTPPAATPAISGPVLVTSTASGACHLNADGNPDGAVETPAAIRVSWGISNPDAARYETHLFENDILVDTQDTAASMHYDKTITGAVEDGIANSFTSDWAYRVRVVRKTTGQSVFQRVSTNWRQAYGGCVDFPSDDFPSD